MTRRCRARRANAGRFWDEACAGNAALRREVESLLRQRPSGDILGQPHGAIAAQVLGVSVENPAQTALTTGTRLGPYEIRERIGRGGMGEVYRAHDPRLGRDVAIKISADRFGERVEREARAVAALNHPNICTLHDVGPNYLVMELLDGVTLADRLTEGPLPLDEAIGIARQIAAALEAAHEAGIVHRDLKPGNIALTSNGSVKVLDFGLAKVPAGTALTPESPTFTIATQPGMILGTAAYMSPEQARGKPVDKRTDIWAFGVVLYEMLTGRRPFDADDMTGMLAAIVTAAPDLTHVPSRVRPVIERCLEKDPKRRLRDLSGATLLLDLPNASVDARRTRAWWVAAAAVTAAASVGVWAVFAYVSSTRAEAPPLPPSTRFVLESDNIPLSDSAQVSPDGARLVFTATDANAVTSKWMRRLGSLEARPLRGTEGNGVLPPVIWSPDSRSIAFMSRPSGLAAGQLKRLDLDSGELQTICDIRPSAVSGAWNTAGVILLGGAFDEGVTRVSEAGGARTPVTALDAAWQERFHLQPQFLADNRHFLYQRVGAAEHTGIYVGDIDLPPERQSRTPLLLSDRHAVYVPVSRYGPAQLVFQRGTALFVQEFDDERFALRGNAIRIADGVGSFDQANAGQFSVSPDVLTYRLASFGVRTQLTWLDAKGAKISTVGEPEAFQEAIAISPDGSRIAASFPDETGNADIWVLDSSKGTRTQLTFDAARDWYPVWSHDGRTIFFASTRSGFQDLYAKAADGSGDERRLLASRDKFLFPSAVSPDGRFLVYSAAPVPDEWALPLNPPGNPIALVQTNDASEVGGRVSPDGRWLAYQWIERSEIHVRRFSPGSDGASPAGPKWRVSRGGWPFFWSPDSTQIFFVGGEPLQQMSIDVDGRGSAFKVTGTPKSMFMIPSGANSSVIGTVDGKRFLVAVKDRPSAAPPVIVVSNWQSTVRR